MSPAKTRTTVTLLVAAIILIFAAMVQARASGAAGYALLGRATLQSRTSFSGITLQAAGQSVTSGPDGSFGFPSLPAGVYSVSARMPGFLSALHEGAPITPGESVRLSEVRLLAGDIDGDDDIDLFDLVILGADFGRTSPSGMPTDLNADNVVNILDLVLLAANYGLVGPSEWVGLAVPVPTPTFTPSPTPTQPVDTPTPTPTPECISAEAAASSVGRDVCVQYHVDEVTQSGSLLYLYAHRPGTEEVIYYTLVNSNLWHCWATPVAETLSDRTIRVQGRVTTSRAYPHIQITSCDQLSILP